MRVILCALALALCGPAWGAVVYEWQTIDDAGYGTALFGRIEIDPAWPGGEYTNTPICPIAVCSGVDAHDPNNPILRIAFGGAPHPYFSGYAIDLHYRTGQGIVFVTIGEFSLGLGPLLSGSIYADSGETTVRMESTGTLWTVSYLDSDAGPFCPGEPNAFDPSRCVGVTGHWVLQQARVPIPGTLALLTPVLYLTARRARTSRRARTTSRA